MKSIIAISLSSVALMANSTSARVAAFELNHKVEAEKAGVISRWWQVHPWASPSPRLVEPSLTVSGYRGIWFQIGTRFELGYKYSGGLGTYTANHQPIAVYAPEVNKTFFTYGGTTTADERKLVIMVSYYDHERGVVPRPVALYADPSVDDPHDNASLHIDPSGHIWVFKSGRSTRRPGIVFRSTRPYDIDEFELVAMCEFTYPQIWHGPGGDGFFLLFTKYAGPARNLYWKTSADGRVWSEDHALANFGGHYQTSGRWQDGGVTKYATFFNYHPGSNVDLRTNIYYAQTTDGGKVWTTADGQPLTLPLSHVDNKALVLNLQAEGRQMYTNDLRFDARGNPVLFCVISRSGVVGPEGGPREWTILHWTGATWERRVVATSDNNYDMGSLYIDGDHWRIIGPSGTGAQPWNTGGEMEYWSSHDDGRTWAKTRALTHDGAVNHSYARRPEMPHPDFAAFWADGHALLQGPSQIYFCNQDGTRVWRLPYNMTTDFAKPESVPVFD